MKVIQLLIAFILAYSGAQASPDPEIKFTETKNGLRTITTCSRDGIEIYKHSLLVRSNNHKYSVYTFYWNKEEALTVLTVNGLASIQQSANIPVSYVIDLDAAQMVSFVAIEGADGKVIDGLWAKNGKLYPVDAEGLRYFKQMSTP